MSRQITTSDICQGILHNIGRKIGLSDIEMYGTDFNNSFIK